MVRRERIGAMGSHIPFNFPTKVGAEELLRVSQPHSLDRILRYVDGILLRYHRNRYVMGYERDTLVGFKQP